MLLQPHTISGARGSRHSPKRVGRGNASGHGTASTRGGKGQTARSGGQRGLQLKAFKAQFQSAPKLRGFTSMATKPEEVYLSDLEKMFDTGATITVADLKTKGLKSLERGKKRLTLLRPMVLFLIPLLLSNILQTIGQVFGMFVVGHWLGEDSLAALSAFFPLFFY